MIRNPYFMKWIAGIRVDLAIHIGGHVGQDHQKYVDLGCKEVIWGEANLLAANKLREKFPRDTVIQKIFWDTSNESIEFYHFQNEERNSAIRPVNSNEDFNTIEKIMTTTLDSEFSNKIISKKTILAIDVQGAELHVLKGGSETLKKIRYIVTEIAERNQGYEITPSNQEIKDLLGLYGFRESIKRPSHDGSYSDVLFIKCGPIGIFWIAFSDRVLALILRSRHLFLKKHIPTSIYSCYKC
jgi:FkbM family methyltransferase